MSAPLHTIVFELDAEGRVATWNAEAALLKGYQAPEVLGQHFEIFYVESDRQEARRALARAATAGHHTAEGWRLRKDGSRFWVEASIVCHYSDTGAVTGYTKVTRPAGMRMRAMFESAAQAILNVGPDGRILMANSMAERMFGWTRAELSGMPVENLIPESFRDAHVGQRNDFFTHPRTRPMGIGLELRALRRDGSEFAAEISLSHVQSGESVHAIAFISDITERRIADRALRSSEERYRITFENAAVGMAHVGLDGRWLRVNRRMCEVVGYTPEELLGTTFQQITHPDDLDADLDLVRRLLSGEIPSFAMEKRYLRKDGGIVWARLTVSLVRSDDGQPQHFISAAEDITARKQVEAAVDRAIEQQRAVSDLGLAALEGIGVQALLQRAVDELCRCLHVEFAEVMELAHDGLTLQPKAAAGWQPPPGQTVLVPVEESEAGYAIRSGAPVIVEDAGHETRFRITGLQVTHGVVSGISVVVSGPAGERPYGVLGAHSTQSRRFTADDVHFLQGVANVLASAIERTRTEREREKLLTRIVAAEVEAKTVLESITDGFCAFDSEWRFTYINTAAERILGVPRGELIGRDHWKVFPAALGTQVEAEYRYAMQQRLSVIFEHESDRLGRWFEVRIYPAANGGLSVYFRDITDRRLAEQRLRDGENLFRTLANSIPQLAWITDASGYVVWFNDRWYDYTGTTFDDVMGWGWEKLHHADHLPRVHERLERAYSSGEPWEDTFPLRGHDGQYRWFLSRAVPLRGENGVVERWFGTNTDITEQLEAERSVRDSQERLRAALEASGTGTFRWDIHTAAMTWDDALDRIFGVPPDKPVHTLDDFLACVHAADRQSVIDGLERSLVEGADFEMEFRVAHVDGPDRWVYNRGRVFFDGLGRPAYMTGAVLDITARRRVESVLRRSNDDLKQFAYAASHDLQEPLRTVTAYTQLLERRYADKLDENARVFIEYAVEAARRMENLLQGMRAYWQASADAEEPLAGSVDSGLALRVALGNLAGLINESGVIVTHDPLPVVRAQEVQLVQVFQNLVGNAIKYRRINVAPEVHVSARRVDSQYLFSVRDNGIGIDPRYARQIFGIFKRLHTQRAYSGTGIGLAICQKVVEALGGRIWVESKGPGLGSEFFFTLPAAKPPDRRRQSP